jgi:uncharacterized protein YeaO (DUF488 family)
MPVSVKRVYEPASRTDGQRVLVDRLWPRGLSKSQAALDEWLRDIAPSDQLRRWYHARPTEWERFRRQYMDELSLPKAQVALQSLYQLAHKTKRLTLLFASKNEKRNNAIVLKELLDGKRKPPSSTGPAAVHAVRPRRAAARRT